MKSTSHRLPSAHCPTCGSELDAATNTDDSTDRPKVGDVTLCFYCSAALAFDVGLSVRHATEAEKREAGLSHVNKIAEALSAFRRRN